MSMSGNCQIQLFQINQSEESSKFSMPVTSAVQSPLLDLPEDDEGLGVRGQGPALRPLPLQHQPVQLAVVQEVRQDLHYQVL